MSRRRRRSEPNIGGIAAVALALLVLSWINQNGEKVVAPAIALIVALSVLAVGYVVFRRWRTRAWLASHTDLETILLMHPRRFEGFCRELMDREGFRSKVTRYTSDQGVDLELSGTAGRGIAQVKRWTGNGVGRPQLQQLYGEMAHRGAVYGYFITTSWFTREAEAWSRGKPISLIDGRDLEQLASRHFGRIRLTSSEILSPVQHRRP